MDLKRILHDWIETPPNISNPPEIRRSFLALTEARVILSKNPSWAAELKGDLQMHTQWSDGSGSIEEMAKAASERGYEYIAITDDSTETKIEPGIRERP